MLRRHRFTCDAIWMETQDLDTVRASRFGATVIMITALYFLTQRFCGFIATVHSTLAQQSQVAGIVTLKRRGSVVLEYDFFRY